MVIWGLIVKDPPKIKICISVILGWSGSPEKSSNLLSEGQGCDCFNVPGSWAETGLDSTVSAPSNQYI